jgi:hypothetical protein
MIATPPHILLLEAALVDLRAVDWTADTGLEHVMSRHQRNRSASSEEKPCVGLVFISDQAGGGDIDHNAWETNRSMTCELVADAFLDAEDSELDPTGLLRLSRMNAAAFRAIATDGSNLRQLCDWVIQSDISTGDNSHADEGRLVTGFSVVYRVKTDDPNTLLAQGVMA